MDFNNIILVAAFSVLIGLMAFVIIGIIIGVRELFKVYPEEKEYSLKDWRESLSKACAEIESQYPIGTIIEFMGVDYCVVGYKQPGYGIYCLTPPALKCIYTDGSGNPKAHYFPVEVFCLIEEFVRSRPDNNSRPK